jgi:hypothetical protein
LEVCLGLGAYDPRNHAKQHEQDPLYTRELCKKFADLYVNEFDVIGVYSWIGFSNQQKSDPRIRRNNTKFPGLRSSDRIELGVRAQT